MEITDNYKWPLKLYVILMTKLIRNVLKKIIEKNILGLHGAMLSNDKGKNNVIFSFKQVLSKGSKT